MDVAAPVLSANSGHRPSIHDTAGRLKNDCYLEGSNTMDVGHFKVRRLMADGPCDVCNLSGAIGINANEGLRLAATAQ